MTRRLLLMRLAAVLAGSAFVYLAFIHAALFPGSLDDPSTEVDPAEGNVWLTSEVAFDVRGHVSEDDVLEGLRIEPALAIDKSDIDVQHSATLPWHERMPWSITRVRINAGHDELFAPETEYKLTFRDVSLDFETIALPRVVEFRAAAPATPDASLDLATLPTTSEIVLRFNEPLRWHDGLLKIDPPVPFVATPEFTADGETVVRVTPAARWENGTNYTLRVDAAVEDWHGHSGGQVFAKTFSTMPRPRVITAFPGGETVPIDSIVRIEFDRDVDMPAVEAAFRTEPAVAGAFTWESPRAMVWKPVAPLLHTTWYRIFINGAAPDGDAVVPHEWAFATHDPPVFVELRGRDYGSTMLEAVATGGLGSYTYQWNTGHNYPKILFNAAPGPQTVVVTVQSGDRIATASMVVTGAPNGYPAQPCPEGWDMIEVSVCYRWEELPGQPRKFITRVDTRDPNIQVRSALSGDNLGESRTVGEAARARGSVAALNGDFFYSANGGQFPLGPVVARGHVLSAPFSGQAVLALSRERSVWAGTGAELRFGVKAANGNWIPLQGVNDIPGPNAASLFNAYWGPTLSLGADGCVAAYLHPDGAARPPDQFGCGSLRGITIPAGGFVIVARGSAAEWLRVMSPAGIAAGFTFPMGNLDFLVGGSHVLVAGHVAPPLPADRQHPRSMIGVDANGFLYMVAIEGRTEDLGGMSLQELQAYALSLGLTNAINLDGGGSTAMAIRGWVVNRPSDGAERGVASIVEVGLTQPSCRHPLVRC